MSNQDEESKDFNLPGYQFFSPDLNYNYFGDQSFATPTVLSVESAVIAAPAATAAESSTYAAFATSAELQQECVPYSLSDSEPELTFEERVAAMDREIAAHEAASARARTAAILTPAPPPAPAPTSDQSSSIPSIASLPVEYSQSAYVGMANIAAPEEEKWNQYAEPTCDAAAFSRDFNFNRSLLKIFWRIDVDHNNRVSKNELAIALHNNWFDSDEKLLATLLYENYEDISPEAIFCDAGLSVNNILNFAPFAPMAAEKLESQAPVQVQPARNNAPAKKSTKSSRSLRSLFNR